MPRREQKRVTVAMSAIYDLDPPEKVAKIREIKGTCDTSDAFKASPACQAALTGWTDRAGELEKKHAVRVAKEAELAAAVTDETKASKACDAAGGIFAATACDTAGGDPSVAKGMGLTPRAEQSPTPELAIVTGVRLDTYKKSGAPRLAWDEALGAKLYRAEMSAEPVSEGSWTALFGTGKTRKVPPLVRGQRYSFRVAALWPDGRQSGWSAVVTIIAE